MLPSSAASHHGQTMHGSCRRTSSSMGAIAFFSWHSASQSPESVRNAPQLSQRLTTHIPAPPRPAPPGRAGRRGTSRCRRAGCGARARARGLRRLRSGRGSRVLPFDAAGSWRLSLVLLCVVANAGAHRLALTALQYAVLIEAVHVEIVTAPTCGAFTTLGQMRCHGDPPSVMSPLRHRVVNVVRVCAQEKVRDV